jgi:hypothetical protein
MNESEGLFKKERYSERRRKLREKKKSSKKLME